MALGLGEMLGLALADAEGLGLTEALGLTEGEAEALALGEADGEALGLAEGLALGEADADGLADGEALGSSLGDALGVAEGSSDGEGLGLADSEAEGPGEAVGISAEDVEFCGSEASLKTKSLALLLLSSPFPPLTSAPEVILSAVEAELAFLSTLLSAAGATKEVPSPKGLATVPKVTASTTVPISTAPFLKATLLLSDIEAPVFLSQFKVGSSEVLHHKKYP